MIEDQKHLGVLAAHIREIQEWVVNYNTTTNGVTDRETLLRLQMEFNNDLAETLRKQSRSLKFMLGDKVEPEMQFAEIVLNGKGGVGAL